MDAYICEQLMSLRKKAKITQAELGKILGMSRSKVSSLEVGRRDIASCDAIVICDFFGISLDALLNPDGITPNKIVDLAKRCISNEKVTYEQKAKMLETITNLESSLKEDAI